MLFNPIVSLMTQKRLPSPTLAVIEKAFSADTVLLACTAHPVGIK